MNSIPRIEVGGWTVQQPLQQPPSSRYIPYRPEYLPAPRTVLHEIDNRCNREQRRPCIVPKNPPLYTFWSRLRRSKSEDPVPRNRTSNTMTRSPAQPARRSETLVWCPERKIWLFPREEDVTPVVDVSMQTSKKKRRPISANFLSLPSSWRRRDADVDEDGMMFAQLPGHYGLNVYDYHGNTLLQRSTEDLGMFEYPGRQSALSRPMTAMASTIATSDENPEVERGWMSVASRLTENRLYDDMISSKYSAGNV